MGTGEINDYEVLKDLIIAEDRVFGDRMNIFLVVNSIMLLAYAQFKVGFVVPLLGIVVDLIWLYVGSLTLSAHKFWRQELVKIEKETLGESKAYREGIFTKRQAHYPWLGKLTGLSATETLTYILPSAFLLMWIYLLVK